MTDRIVRPTNGPASAKLAALVQRDLLPEEPYRSYGIELDDFFADPSPRMIVDLTSLSNRLWGWKSDAGILRDVGVEAVRTHPGTYASGVTTTVWDLLWQPVFRNVPVEPAEANGEPPSGAKSTGGETVVINGRRLPKPSEGERIPAPHEQAPTTPDGGNYTVWTSPSESHVVYRRKTDERRVEELARHISQLEANLPGRTGSTYLSLRINQASNRFPPPAIWLAIGVVALFVRRPARALAAITPAIAGLIVILLSALAIPSVPHYSVPVAPAFLLLAAAALCGRSTARVEAASDYRSGS